MYARSTPTKSITTVNYNFEGQTLTDTTTLISGKIDGNLEAATLTQITQRLRTVEAGSNAAILPFIEETVTNKEYLEGRGVRVNGGAWDSAAKNFAPSDGSITLNLTEEVMLNAKESDKTITFNVAKANTEAVFGKVINANVSVTIKHDGASIVSIDIVYVESATKNPDTPETRVEISVKYSYDIENVTIGAK